MKNKYIILSDNRFQLFSLMSLFITAGYNFEWRASANALIVEVGDEDFNDLDNMAETHKFDFRAFVAS